MATERGTHFLHSNQKEHPSLDSRLSQTCFLALWIVSHQPGQNHCRTGSADSALEIYGLRWGIETLFSALKKRGFNLETTHLTDIKRIEKLVAILAITLSWAHLVGEWLAEQQPLKIKKHGYQAKIIFRYGLDYLQYLLLNLTHRIQQLLQCFHLWSEAIDSRL